MITLPLYCERGAGWPSMLFMVKSSALEAPKSEDAISTPPRRNLCIPVADAAPARTDASFYMYGARRPGILPRDIMLAMKHLRLTVLLGGAAFLLAAAG